MSVRQKVEAKGWSSNEAHYKWNCTCVFGGESALRSGESGDWNVDIARYVLVLYF